MSILFDRRRFITAAGAATAGLIGTGKLSGVSWADEPEPTFKTTPHKALIGAPDEATLKQWKAVGIEGMEAVGEKAWRRPAAEAARYHLMAERLGMRIHSVLFGWVNLDSPDAGTVARDLDNLATGLRAAQGYGADTLLIVPCQLPSSKKRPVPRPWQFDIKFDEKTGHIREVVAGNNAKFENYIKAHNHAYDACQKAIRKLIPVAEQTGVVIAIENVWNSFCVKPALFKHFVASFNSHWVQAYFDIANHVKYAPPEEWIRTLGRLIVKVHVKDFRLNDNGQGGKWVNLRDNGIDWPLIRRELDKIGYSGWMTLEGSGRLSLEEKAKRLDLVLAGK